MEEGRRGARALHHDRTVLVNREAAAGQLRIHGNAYGHPGRERKTEHLGPHAHGARVHLGQCGAPPGTPLGNSEARLLTRRAWGAAVLCSGNGKGEAEARGEGASVSACCHLRTASSKRELGLVPVLDCAAVFLFLAVPSLLPIALRQLLLRMAMAMAWPV